MKSSMRILITGSNGFIGKNLVSELKNRGYSDIYEYDINSTEEDLDNYCSKCDFVFHLAGVNRPKSQEEFIAGNYGLTTRLLHYLKKHNNDAPIMLASSIQASLDNPYGISKKKGEEILYHYSKENKVKIFIYRFPNVFGKWSKPNYNSVIATFSHNIANDIPITINDDSKTMELIYIDDLIDEIIRTLDGNENRVDEFCYVNPIYTRKLTEIADLLHSFKLSRDNLSLPNLSDPFIKKLYATFLSYLPTNKLIYRLNMHSDLRGSFTEFIKTLDRGQFSINISYPGVTKGNHWHHTKHEKFLVVSGYGIIRLRKIDELNTVEFFVNGNELTVVDIPPGYTHNIQNVGKTNLVTIMWANEIFDKNVPDTFFEEVIINEKD